MTRALLLCTNQDMASQLSVAKAFFEWQIIDQIARDVYTSLDYLK